MRRRPSLRAVSLALLASLLGCGAEDRPAGNATSARTGAPGIVLLCIDTLRADGVTLVPGAKGFMPALDAFARGATAFSDASSSSSWTAPSIATLLTGLLPENTGVRGAFTAGTLVGAVTTIAETLREHGFSTAASTAGGWISPHLGFGQGFESFSTRFDADGPEAAIAAWDAARAKAKPFFLFLHTVAAHDPYGPKDRAWGRADLLPLVAERAMALYRETKDAGWKLQPGAAPWFLELFLYGPQARHTVGEALGAESWDHLWTLVLDWLDGEGRGSPELAAIAGKAAAAYRESLKVKDRGVVHVGLARLCQKTKDAACVKEQLDAALQTASGEELRETLDLTDLLVAVGRKHDALMLLAAVSAEPEQRTNFALHLRVARLAKELKEKAVMKSACERVPAGPAKCP